MIAGVPTVAGGKWDHHRTYFRVWYARTCPADSRRTYGDHEWGLSNTVTATVAKNLFCGIEAAVDEGKKAQDVLSVLFAYFPVKARSMCWRVSKTSYDPFHE